MRPRLRVVVPQPEKQPERDRRGDDGDRDRRRDEQRVVTELRRHANGRHSGVMHRYDGEPETDAGGDQSPAIRRSTGWRRTAQTPTRRPRRGTTRRRAARRTRSARQVEREHRDEVHAPDAAAHRDASAGQPGETRAAARDGDASGQRQRGVRRADGDENRQRNQRELVRALHENYPRSGIESTGPGRAMRRTRALSGIFPPSIDPAWPVRDRCGC